ncbi:GyrI-like domain-containing protein [Flavitalea flava]
MIFSIKENFNLALYGITGVATNRNWAATGMMLMNKMWQQVKANNLEHKGINIWVYEEGDKMFAGVELMTPPPPGTELELKQVRMTGYVYYKHIGPYNKIAEACSRLQEELRQEGIKTHLPYLEIYGHWTENPSQLETEILWSLK